MSMLARDQSDGHGTLADADNAIRSGTVAGVGPSEVSFIVQGPIYRRPAGADGVQITKRVLESVRQHFPGCELILSTWKGSDVRDLDYDCLLLNDDPGSWLRDETNRYYHNVNRQIASTLSGLQVASREYAVKTRTDVIFTHGKCLGYINKYTNRSEDCRFTRGRVLVATVTSVNPRRNLQLPFHPCDWFYCGLTEDLLDIFTIPLFPEPAYTEWFKTRTYPCNHPNRTSMARYAAESYIWYSFCRKYLDVAFDHLCDVANNSVAISERTFANNLVILKPSQLGIVSLKKPFLHSYLYYMYTFTEWKALYNKHCGGNLSILIDVDLWFNKACYYYEDYRRRFGLRTRIKKLIGKGC